MEHTPRPAALGWPGCVLPVRPGSGGGPAPPRALCGWRRRGRLRYGHSRAGPLRDRGRPSRLEGGRRAPTRDGLTVVMYTCRLRAGAHPPHDRLPTARPGWLPRRSRDGRAGAPALKASIPRPGSCARPDCFRRGYAAEARSCRNRDRCGRHPRTPHRPGATCITPPADEGRAPGHRVTGHAHVDRTSDVLRSDSSTTKRGTAVRCTTGVFRSSVRMY